MRLDQFLERRNHSADSSSKKDRSSGGSVKSFFSFGSHRSKKSRNEKSTKTVEGLPSTPTPSLPDGLEPSGRTDRMLNGIEEDILQKLMETSSVDKINVKILASPSIDDTSSRRSGRSKTGRKSILQRIFKTRKPEKSNQHPAPRESPISNNYTTTSSNKKSSILERSNYTNELGSASSCPSSPETPTSTLKSLAQKQNSRPQEQKRPKAANTPKNVATVAFSDSTRVLYKKSSLKKSSTQNRYSPKPSFEWTIRSQCGIYTGPHLKGNIPHGMGTLHFANGAVYTGPFKDGNMHGSAAKFTTSSGATYVGDFVRSVKHGYGEEIFKSGRRYVGRYRRGRPHGFGIQYAQSGGILHAGDWNTGKPIKRVSAATPLTFEMKVVEEMALRHNSREPGSTNSSSGSSSASTTYSEDTGGEVSIYDDAVSLYSTSSRHSTRSLQSTNSSFYDGNAEDASIPIASDISPVAAAIRGKFSRGGGGILRRPKEVPPLAADILTMARPIPSRKKKSMYA